MRLYDSAISGNSYKVPLDDTPHVRAWLDRVRAQPGFVPMRTA